MRIYNLFAVLFLSAGLLVSCSKSSGIDEPAVPQPQEPETPTATLPNITFGKPSTKVMLNDADLKVAGSKIHVYDYLSDYTGTVIEGFDPDTDPYIDEEIIYNKRGLGYFVTPGARKQILKARKKAFMKESLPELFRQMQLLDISIEDVAEAYKSLQSVK